ncbi:MAG TPA: hypothetical protein PK571_09610 [Methylotenera sp.]|nr:hypothetical protein [Methylotenera sp.]
MASKSIKLQIAALNDKYEAKALRELLEAVLADLESVETQFNQLRTDYNAHVHGGVAAGSANTAAPTATTATALAVTLQA